MHKRRQAGFTLLEVMVVIVILGILASLVVPNLMGNKEKADQQKAVSDIVALENALDMYKLDNNRYPTTEQGLDALVNKPTASRRAVQASPSISTSPASASAPSTAAMNAR